MKTLSKLAVWVILSFIRVSVSWADFHLVQIEEVMAGAGGDPTIQFIELKMLSSLQKCQGTGNIIDFSNGGHCDGSGPGARLVFFNAQGVQIGEFVFPTNTPIGAFDGSILIATQKFAELPTASQPDFVMPPNIVPNSGKVCYKNRDSAPFIVNNCLSYGNFLGDTEGFGTPAAALPIDGALSLKRIAHSFNNSIDFSLGTPIPRNNSGHCAAVSPVNRCPIAHAQTVMATEDTPINILLTGSDPEGAPLIFSLVMSTRNGFLSGTLPNVTYRPSFNFNGSDSFTFKVNDGTFDSTAATVSIVVTAANDPPFAQQLFVSTVKNIAINLILSGADPDSQPLNFSLVTAPLNGILSGTLPNLTYTPNAEFLGVDTFSFKVSDGALESDPGIVTIRVNENLPPRTFDQSISAVSGTPLQIIPSGFDPDSLPGPLTFHVVSLPAHGILNGEPPKLTYTADLGFSGMDTFSFKVNDGLDDSNVAVVNIAVSPACSLTPIRSGETKNGELGNADCFAPHRPGSLADLYTFSGMAGQRVSIQMDFSSPFDPFLILVGPDGNALAMNDGCLGGGLNSCIPFDTLSGRTFTLPLTGTYTIEATSLLSAATGTYTMSLTIAAPLLFTLTVNKFGNGRGTVRSNNIDGIDCGSDCTESLLLGTVVSLTATPDAGTTFQGWSANRCFGTGTCLFNISDNTIVTATFNALPLIIDATSLPDAEVNVAYNADLGISGGVPPYTFQFLRGSLPAGLTIDSQGVITGIPIATRKSTFTLQVIDQNNITASKTFSIKPFKPVSIATRRLRAAKVGMTYNATLKGTGGKASYSWSHDPDTFPPWLNLDTITGQLTGTPPGLGIFTLTFQITDAMGGQAQKTLNLVVN